MTQARANSNRSRALPGHVNHAMGFTLIEVLLVLALTSALLGGTIGVLSIARQSNQQATHNLFQRQEIRRFADDLRRDVRRAQDSVLDQEGLVLSSPSPDWNITYRIESDARVSRSVAKDNRGAHSKDSYGLGDDTTIQVQWLDQIDAVQWTIWAADELNQPIQIIAARRSTS